MLLKEVILEKVLKRIKVNLLYFCSPRDLRLAVKQMDTVIVSSTKPERRKIHINKIQYAD